MTSRHDIKDKEWELIKDILPNREGTKGKKVDNRK